MFRMVLMPGWLAFVMYMCMVVWYIKWGSGCLDFKSMGRVSQAATAIVFLLPVHLIIFLMEVQ